MPTHRNSGARSAPDYCHFPGTSLPSAKNMRHPHKRPDPASSSLLVCSYWSSGFDSLPGTWVLQCPCSGPATLVPLGFSSSHHSRSQPPCPSYSWITPFLKAAVFPDLCASQSSLERQCCWKTCHVYEGLFQGIISLCDCVMWGWQV